MLHEQISRSPDLQKLVEAGYEVEIRAGYLILHRIPYVTSQRQVKYGKLVSSVTINNQEVGQPADHTVYFQGDRPCDDAGRVVTAIWNSSQRIHLTQDLYVDQYFSAKPRGGNYQNYYDKMTHYAQVITQYARRIDPQVTAQPGRVTLTEDSKDPFNYMDTASSRAGITQTNEMLAGDKIGIVGVGGTGSYILDYLVKTRVAEIHLFDGDVFQQHNAFRAPGATTKKEIGDKWNKAELYASKYSKMRQGIVAHAEFVEPSTVANMKELELNFLFVSIDDDDTKKWLLPALQAENIAFIDVGMGIQREGEKLLGIIRTSISTPQGGYYKPQMEKIKASDGQQRGGEYERNIQIVELNALNAALAIIRWKKYRGFYLDLEGELQSTYTLDGNHMSNSGGQTQHREQNESKL